MEKAVLKSLAPFLVILAGCMWGSLGYFVRYLSAINLSNMTIVECRMGGAMIIMVIGLMVYDRNILKIKLKDIWCFIGTGMLSMAFFNYCYNVAINITSLSLAAILLSTAPIFVIVLAKIIFHEKITTIKLISL
ncbi:MAG: DMT family transporter [Bacillota bacterium]